LGFRRKGYKPTLLDYKINQGLCIQFFQSPRDRAALFAGGIIGRLAREGIANMNEDLACMGPTSEAVFTGVCLWDGNSAEAYWDDMLTESEIDLICGVYEIATGARTDEVQTARVSWWPRPNAFSHSGMNTGWWSPDCERWYQQRLALIRANRATLNTQTDWKRFIELFKASREVALNNEKIAAQFLDSRITKM
ncbi:hypothetical protein B0H14DRAFT_2398127, partial [Mycena olivaceomarginata]